MSGCRWLQGCHPAGQRTAGSCRAASRGSPAAHQEQRSYRTFSFTLAGGSGWWWRTSAAHSRRCAQSLWSLHWSVQHILEENERLIIPDFGETSFTVIYQLPQLIYLYVFSFKSILIIALCEIYWQSHPGPCPGQGKWIAKLHRSQCKSDFRADSPACP